MQEHISWANCLELEIVGACSMGEIRKTGKYFALS